MNNLKKIALISGIIAILLISIAIFWHYVIYLPTKEKAKIRAESYDKLSEETKEKEEKRQQELDLSKCLMNADSRYHKAWNNECEFLGKLSKECKELLDLDYSEYLEKYNMTSEDYAKLRDLEKVDLPDLQNIMDYYERRDDCSCRLPISSANRFEEDLDKWKDECFKKYPVIK